MGEHKDTSYTSRWHGQKFLRVGIDLPVYGACNLGPGSLQHPNVTTGHLVISRLEVVLTTRGSSKLSCCLKRASLNTAPRGRSGLRASQEMHNLPAPLATFSGKCAMLAHVA